MSKLLSLLSLSSLALAVVGLAVAPASAFIRDYDLTGSVVAFDNTAAGGTCAGFTCSTALTGTLTIDDDEIGGITLSNFDVSHALYEVASPPFISILRERSTWSPTAATVSGTGSTLSSAVTFGSESIDQTGTSTCTDGFITCVSVGETPGPVAMPSPVVIDLGIWTFNAGRNFTAEIEVNFDAGSGSFETYYLVGTAPEPGTGLLAAGGLLALGAWRRRNR